MAGSKKRPPPSRIILELGVYGLIRFRLDATLPLATAPDLKRGSVLNAKRVITPDGAAAVDNYKCWHNRSLDSERMGAIGRTR